MGEYSTLADRVDVYNLGRVTIGDHSVVSQGAEICAGTHDYTKPDLPLIRSEITIGSGVWVCASAFLSPGVTIGHNSIVAARAVVTRDVPDGVIVGGNPAKVLRDRPMLGPPTG
jgi:putative colanic acid biosynthesis acetyltransferase WcaF